MKLQEALERNKNKIPKSQYEIKPVSIATDDRPYDYPIFSKNKREQTKEKQTDDKAWTNYRQNDDKAMPNEEQTDDKVETNYRQTAHQTRDKSADKNTTKIKMSFSSLTGLQRYITLSIYKLCKVSRDKKTKEISISQLSHFCKSPVKSVKKSICRLIEKEILFRDSFKNGRGGWTIYYLPNDIYQEIMNIETDDILTINWRQTDDKVLPKLMTTTHSSSGNNIKNTTTDDNINSTNKVISEEWLDIDIGPLASIGFSKTHLSQISSQNKLSAQIVQDSIYAFAFDIQENNKVKSIKGDPINFFMGILRKGEPYTPPSNYESPQDKLMRVYRERMREIEQGREALEKESKDLAYREWFSKLTDDQKRQHLPENLRRNARIEKNKMLEGSARNHFENEVWPDLKKEITQQTSVIEQGGDETKN